MKKKVMQKIIPFLQASPSVLGQMIDGLNPQELGETRNLLKIRLQEMEAELPAVEEKVAKYSQESKEYFFGIARERIKKVENVVKLFDDVYAARKEQKILQR